MLEARAHEVVMDLIGDDEHVVLQADGGERRELLEREDAPCGVVRVAEQEELDVVLDDGLLELYEIDLVMAVFEQQRAVHELAVVVADDGAERVVDGLLDEDGVAGGREGLDGHREREDDARRHDEAISGGRIAVLLAHPAREHLAVRGPRVGVAEDTVLDAARELVEDGLRRAEVHVRHPERQHVLRVAALRGKIVFEAGGTPPVDDFIKIVRHGIESFPGGNQLRHAARGRGQR